MKIFLTHSLLCLLVRYIYNDMKRLNFSNFKLIKQIDRKIILNSVLSEMVR